MKPMKPSLGRIVHYLLTEEQQKEILAAKGGLPTFGSEGEEQKEVASEAPAQAPTKAMAFIIGPEEIAPSEETPVTLLVMCSNGMPFRVENAVQGTASGNWFEPERV